MLFIQTKSEPGDFNDFSHCLNSKVHCLLFTFWNEKLIQNHLESLALFYVFLEILERGWYHAFQFYILFCKIKTNFSRKTCQKIYSKCRHQTTCPHHFTYLIAHFILNVSFTEITFLFKRQTINFHHNDKIER